MASASATCLSWSPMGRTILTAVIAAALLASCGGGGKQRDPILATHLGAWGDAAAGYTSTMNTCAHDLSPAVDAAYWTRCTGRYYRALARMTAVLVRSSHVPARCRQAFRSTM